MIQERRLSVNGSKPHTTTHGLPPGAVAKMIAKNGVGGISISLCTIVIGGLLIYLLISRK